MPSLVPLTEIPVPPASPGAVYTVELFGKTYRFDGLKALLGAADFDKAGDRLAGLAATSDIAREAARKILSGLTLRHLYERPLTDDDGRIDDIMRVNYAVDLEIFPEFADLTLGEIKNFILRSKPVEVKRLGAALHTARPSTKTPNSPIVTPLTSAARARHAADIASTASVTP